MAELPKCMGCKRKFSPLPATASDHAPLLLKCSHTFCKRCITKWVMGKREIYCPTCNATTECINGIETVAELWPNIYYAGIMACGSDILSLSKCFSRIDEIAEVSHLKREKSLSTLCSECVRAVATCRCCQCSADMCEKCFSSIHTNFRLLQQHTKVALRPSLTETECAEHNRLLEFYCEDDKTPVCPECMISKTHRSHKIVQMTCKYESYKQKIKHAKLQAESAFLLSSKVKSRIKNEVRHVKKDAYEQAKIVQSQYLACISKLQVNYLTIIRELEDCAVFSCDELLCHLADIEEKELQIKDACSDAELMISEDAKMRIVLDPEKLLSVLEEFATLPYNFEKTLEFEGSDAGLNDTAMKSEYFEFTPSPEMLSLFQKFGEIEITKGFSFKVDAIGNNIGILDAIPLPKELEKPPVKNQVAKTEVKKELCSQESVKVTYVESATNFKVQRISDGSHIAGIERSLNPADGKIKLTRLQSVSVGELCAANYDATGRWYRARVVEKITDCSKSDSNLTKTEPLSKCSEFVTSPNAPRICSNNIVEVCFIDYGNSTMSKVKCLRRLPQELKELPGLGISCCLHNILPTAGTWTVEANEYFAKLINDQQLLMTTRRRENGVRYVNLHRPCAEEIDDDVPLNIADTLVFLGFARRKGPPLHERKLCVPTRKFLTPTLLGLNSLNEVSISYLESPERFYVQRSDRNKVYLEEMERKIQIWVKKQLDGTKAKAFSDVVHRLQLLCPRVGMICLAYFPANGVWYRAEVVGVNEDRTVDIDFVDFGNKETIHFSGLMKIPEMFTRLPVQALRCKLHHVKSLPEEETFSSVCVKRFAELGSTSDLIIMDIREITGAVYSVDLYDSSGDGSDLSSISNHLHREGLLKSERGGPSGPITSSKNDAASAEGAVDDSAKTRVRITHVVSPASFYLQTESSSVELNKMLRRLQAEMEETLNNAVEETWKAGELCASKSSKEKRWCRGRIESLDTDTCCVILIDFGWRETVPACSLKRLPEEFHDTNHAYLLHCALGGVIPAGGTEKWTTTATECFKELTDDEECLMEVLSNVGPDRKAVVDLWIDIPQHDNDGDSDNLMAVSKTLIMKGLALPIRRCKGLGVDRNMSQLQKVMEGVPVQSIGSHSNQVGDSSIGKSPKDLGKSIDTPKDMNDKYRNDLEHDMDDVESVNTGSGVSLTQATAYMCESVKCDDVSIGIQLPYPTVPVLSVGKKIRCSVSHVHNSDVFYVKRHVGMDDADDDQGLMDEGFEWKMAMMSAQSADKTPVLIDEVQEMMPCLCLYDNDQRWHRAIVLSKTMQFLLVQYVDFGTLEEVPIERLRHISDSLVQLPVQAFMCGLANQPSVSDDEHISFMRKFCSKVQGCYLEAEVHTVEKADHDFRHYLCLHIVSLYSESGTKLNDALCEQ